MPLSLQLSLHFLLCSFPNSHQYLRDLINPAVNLVVENAGNEETLHVGDVDVQLLGDEGNVNSSVRLDQLDQNLRSDVA